MRKFSKSSSTLTAILITTISLTLIGTTYFFSKSLLESATSENFEVIDIINNKIIIRNLGNKEIKEIKVLVDGKEIETELEEPIEPYSVGTLILNLTGIEEGRHELTLISKSMSQSFEWKIKSTRTTTTIQVGEEEKEGLTKITHEGTIGILQTEGYDINNVPCNDPVPSCSCKSSDCFLGHPCYGCISDQNCTRASCSVSCPSLPHASLAYKNCSSKATASGCTDSCGLCPGCGVGYFCRGGECSATCSEPTGGCYYNCDQGWYNDDEDSSNGCENQAPKWSSLSVNESNPKTGEVVSFNVKWDDTSGELYKGRGINYTWFSWSAGGKNCDTWENVSESYTPQYNTQSLWFNFTHTIPDECVDKTITWKQYANDSAGRENVSAEGTIYVVPGILNVSLLEPNPTFCNESNPCEWCALFVKRVEASVDCEESTCGVVNATVRINTSLSSANTTIAVPIPVQAKSSKGDEREHLRKSDDLRAYEMCVEDTYCSSPYIWFNLSSPLSNRVEIEGYYLYGGFESVGSSYIECFSKSGEWDEIGQLTLTEEKKSFDIENCEEVDGKFLLRAYCEVGTITAGEFVYCEIYIDFVRAVGSPLYITETMVRPTSHSTYSYFATIDSPEKAYDKELNDTSSWAELQTSWTSGSAMVNYSFFLTQPFGKLFVTSYSSGTATRKLRIFNFSSNNWFTWLTPSSDIDTYSIEINASSGLISSDGQVIFSPYISQGNALLRIYDVYISSIGNNIPVAHLKADENRKVWWKVNVSTCEVQSRKINVLFSSSLSVENQTNNAVIKIVPGANVYDVSFNTTSFQYGDPLNCSGNVTDIKEAIRAVYYKIYHEGNENNPEYEGTIDINTHCIGSNWTSGKICWVVEDSVKGLKGNWTCEIIAECPCGNHSGFSDPIPMINTPPPKSSIILPKNNTWFNKYQDYATIKCQNVSPDVNPEDTLSFTIEWSYDGVNWNTLCSNDPDGECYLSLFDKNDGDVYLRCKASDGEDDGEYSDIITIRIDRTDPTCILNITNITLSPYTLKGIYQDSRSGMSNVTYRYYDGGWNLIGTNSTQPYTWNWDVPSSLENKFINISATCNDTAGNDVTNQTYIAVDLVNENPRIWNLVIYDDQGNVINKTFTSRLINITVNVSDPDPVRGIDYVEGNFTWPNGTMDYQNLSLALDKTFTHFWNYTVVYYMPPGNASIKVIVLDKDDSLNETSTTLEILETVEIMLEDEPIDFQEARPGEEVNATSGRGWPLKVFSRSNVPVNISQNGTNLVGVVNPSSFIDVQRILWGLEESGSFASLQEYMLRVIDYLQPATYVTIFYKLKVPTVEPQKYQGNVTIRGEG